jgi:1,4-alpha-glucan branching enzyme
MSTWLSKFLLLVTCTFTFAAYNFSQVIDVTPEYPTINDSVDVTFHVDSCGCNLIGYTGDIYAHTGLLTSESVDDGDWKFVIAGWNQNIEKAKLEKIDNSTFVLHITPDIFSYYGITEEVDAEKLAFVFRSSDRSKQTANIYYNLFEPGLSVMISDPKGNMIVENGEVISINARAIALGTGIPDSLVLYVDNNEEFIDYSDSLTYDYTASGTGQHWIKVVAQNEEYLAADSVFFFIRDEIITEELPEGVRDGINIINDTAITSVIYAPNKESVILIGDFSDWELSNEFLLKRTPDGNRFWIALNNLVAGEEYAFQYVIDGTIRIADPYSEKILDPENDPDIPVSTYPDLKVYPYGKTTGIVGVFQTMQEEYQWETAGFEPPAVTDLVIYELHVQNYTTAGNIKSVTDTLDYLENLGINAIELMPVNEFEGNQSWGYNPSFYFAFDKTYGTKNDFKTFVDACHSRGIAVIIDLVLNHSYSQSPLVQMYLDAETNKPTADNPWYNVNHNFVDNTSAHWGYDFNHESLATQNLVDSITSFWMSEYKIDGFRFDFTKGFSNTLWYGTNNWASTYDADRIAILKRMSDEIWARKNNAYVIFEHLSDNSEETELADYGIMLWGNMNHDYNEATMGYTSNLYWGAYTNRGWSEPHLVTYMESHDEERLMYKNQRWGNSNETYNVKDLNTALFRMETAAAFFFTIPGPKMMFQWGELGDDYSINRCTDGTVDDNGGCRLDPKPLAWDYYGDPSHYRLYKVFESLIKLRIEEDLFETTDFSLATTGTMKKILLNSNEMNAVILGNFGITEGSVIPAFQHTGTWYNYMTGEALEVTDVNAEITLSPGKYKIYTDIQLETPELPDEVRKISTTANQDIMIYPNPNDGNFLIAFPEAGNFHFELYTLSGQIVLSRDYVNAGRNIQLRITDSQLEPENGIYVYRIILNDSIIQGKLILEK